MQFYTFFPTYWQRIVNALQKCVFENNAKHSIITVAKIVTTSDVSTVNRSRIDKHQEKKTLDNLLSLTILLL